MKTMMKRQRFSVQKGIGLVEILVALLILAIGVLGYAGLQLAALKGAEEANNRSQATLIGQDALERIDSTPISWVGVTESQTKPVLRRSLTRKRIICWLSC